MMFVYYTHIIILKLFSNGLVHLFKRAHPASTNRNSRDTSITHCTPEIGTNVPGFSFLHKIATALNAKIELRLVPEDEAPVIPHL